MLHQFQAIRLYYHMPGIDIDRCSVDGRYRQVMLAPRELSADNLPSEHQTFVNRRFKYTHGHGVAMASAHDFTHGGQPNLLVKDIPPVSASPELAVERPEIYYGETTHGYVVANSREPEFDYPSGSENVYTRYAGTGGVEINGFFRKLRGNALVIPVEDTLLHVEPIFLQADTAAYPELRVVVVMHGDRMSYANSLDAAQLLLGAALGAFGGYAGRALLSRVRLPAAGLYAVFTVALALVTFAAVTLLSGSGFLAVYVAGVVLGNGPLPYRAGLLHAHDAVAWLSQTGMFLLLGLLVLPRVLVAVAGPGLGIALLLAFVARPLAVVPCLVPFRYRAREIVYVAWVGLRGAVPIILATFPILAHAPGAHRIFNLVFFVVVVSGVAQGASTRAVTRWLGLEAGGPPPPPASVDDRAQGRSRAGGRGLHRCLLPAGGPARRRGPVLARPARLTGRGRWGDRSVARSAGERAFVARRAGRHTGTPFAASWQPMPIVCDTDVSPAAQRAGLAAASLAQRLGEERGHMRRGTYPAR